MIIAAANICFVVMNILNNVATIVGRKIPLYMNIIIMTIRFQDFQGWNLDHQRS